MYPLTHGIVGEIVADFIVIGWDDNVVGLCVMGFAVIGTFVMSEIVAGIIVIGWGYIAVGLCVVGFAVIVGVFIVEEIVVGEDVGLCVKWISLTFQIF